jgi:hypothetical protein
MNINYLRNFYVSRVTYLTTPRSAPGYYRFYVHKSVGQFRAKKHHRSFDNMLIEAVAFFARHVSQGNKGFWDLLCEYLVFMQNR